MSGGVDILCEGAGRMLDVRTELSVEGADELVLQDEITARRLIAGLKGRWVRQAPGNRRVEIVVAEGEIAEGEDPEQVR